MKNERAATTSALSSAFLARYVCGEWVIQNLRRLWRTGEWLLLRRPRLHALQGMFVENGRLGITFWFMSVFLFSNACLMVVRTEVLNHEIRQYVLSSCVMNSGMSPASSVG